MSSADLGRILEADFVLTRVCKTSSSFLQMLQDSMGCCATGAQCALTRGQFLESLSRGPLATNASTRGRLSASAHKADGYPHSALCFQLKAHFLSSGMTSQTKQLHLEDSSCWVMVIIIAAMRLHQEHSSKAFIKTSAAD